MVIDQRLTGLHCGHEAGACDHCQRYRHERVARLRPILPHPHAERQQRDDGARGHHPVSLEHPRLAGVALAHRHAGAVLGQLCLHPAPPLGVLRRPARLAAEPDWWDTRTPGGLDLTTKPLLGQAALHNTKQLSVGHGLKGELLARVVASIRPTSHFGWRKVGPHRCSLSV